MLRKEHKKVSSTISLLLKVEFNYITVLYLVTVRYKVTGFINEHREHGSPPLYLCGFNYHLPVEVWCTRQLGSMILGCYLAFILSLVSTEIIQCSLLLSEWTCIVAC